MRGGPQWPGTDRVNLDIDGVAEPEHVPWVDAAHPMVH